MTNDLPAIATLALDSVTGGVARTNNRGDNTAVTAAVTSLKTNLEDLKAAQASKSSSSSTMMPMMMMMMMRR